MLSLDLESELSYRDPRTDFNPSNGEPHFPVVHDFGGGAPLAVILTKHWDDKAYSRLTGEKLK